MKCSFCSLETKKKLGFDTLFSKKEDFYLCTSCREHIDINVLEVGEYTLYYFADYEFLKDEIYSIKYFGDVACAVKFKNLLNKFFSLNYFDLVTIVPANEIREIIRGFDHIEQVCNLCDKLHKERKENMYHLSCGESDLESVESILIIDDIYTSGNTLLGCAKTIKEAYPNIKISFLTLSKVI